MHKGALVYIIMFIVLVVLILVFIPESPINILKPSTSTMSTTTAQITVPPRTSTSTIPVVTCLSAAATEPMPFGNFSTDTFDGWNVSGNGFGTGPMNISKANAQRNYTGSVPWTGLNGYAATTYTGGPVSQGNITSTHFLAVEPYLNFKVISPKDTDFYVAIVYRGAPVIKEFYNTFSTGNTSKEQDIFMNASIPLATLLCQNVSVRVVSQEAGSLKGPNPYLAVGGFYLSRNASYNASVPWNVSYG